METFEGCERRWTYSWLPRGVESRSVHELPALLEGGDGVVWVDIPSCDDEAERVLLDVFKFHPLAVLVDRDHMGELALEVLSELATR